MGVIQQGMNENNRQARRYHWLGESVKDFVCEPHQAVCCDRRGETLNLVAQESDPARRVISELAREKPERLLRNLALLQEKDMLRLPARHRVELADIHPQNLHRVLLKRYERQPENFAALVGHPGGRAEGTAGFKPALGTGLWHAAQLPGPGPLQLRPQGQGRPPLPGGPGHL